MSNRPERSDAGPAPGPAPAVSVLMPAHDAAATLAEAAASVLGQDFADLELIVIDDASRDGTAGVARDLAAADSRVRLIQLAVNGGAAAARNAGLAAARGRWIAFLDADDLWLPGKLSRQIAFMQEKGAALSFTAFRREAGARVRAVRVPATVSRAQLLHGNVIGCLTAVYDTAVLGKVPMPALRMRQDFALWLAILERVPLAHGLDEVLAVHRRRPESLSSGAWRSLAATWRMYRSAAGLGRVAAARCLVAHVWNRFRTAR